MPKQFHAPVAVIDWVAFTLELQHTSNGGYLRNAHAHLGVSHVLPLNRGAGGAASKFEIRMQHPSSYATIGRLLSDLDSKYGLASKPVLRGVEVSIDFYHQNADASWLREMTERLMVSIAPEVINNPRIIGDRHDFSESSLPSRRAVDVTKTLYIGDIGDDVMWRVYWKRTDETFVGEEGKRVPKSLPPSDHRARVEVRLQGRALEGFNLLSVDDLRGFAFERLHSQGLFKFAKRDRASGPIFTNKYAAAAGHALGINDDSPACVLNRFGRRDRRGRMRTLSRYLVTNTELTEASRYALRQLTRRFA